MQAERRRGGSLFFCFPPFSISYARLLLCEIHARALKCRCGGCVININLGLYIGVNVGLYIGISVGLYIDVNVGLYIGINIGLHIDVDVGVYISVDADI